MKIKILFFLFFFIIFNGCKKDKDQIIKKTVSIDQFQLSYFNDLKLELQFTANQVFSDISFLTYSLQEVHSKIYENEFIIVNISANQGQYFVNEKILELSQNVILKKRDGDYLETTQLNINLKKELIHNNSPIHGVLGGKKVIGEAFSLNLKTNKFVIQNAKYEF